MVGWVHLFSIATLSNWKLDYTEPPPYDYHLFIYILFQALSNYGINIKYTLPTRFWTHCSFLHHPKYLHFGKKASPRLYKLIAQHVESSKPSGLIRFRTVIVCGQSNTFILVLLPETSVSLGVCPIVQNRSQHREQGQGSPSSKHTFAKCSARQVVCSKISSVLCVVCIPSRAC